MRCRQWAGGRAVLAALATEAPAQAPRQAPVALTSATIDTYMARASMRDGIGAARAPRTLARRYTRRLLPTERLSFLLAALRETAEQSPFEVADKERGSGSRRRPQ